MPGLERREQVDELREAVGELARRDAQHLGEQRDEDRAEIEPRIDPSPPMMTMPSWSIATVMGSSRG